MSTLTIEVQSYTFGGTQAVSAPKPVQLMLPVKPFTVGELIRHTVEAQLQACLVKRRLETQQTRPALDQQYLTVEEIKEKSVQGKVNCPSTLPSHPTIDPQLEVEKAIEAFESGSYIILAGNHQVEHLNEELTLTPETKVTFLRLMPLVGG